MSRETRRKIVRVLEGEVERANFDKVKMNFKFVTAKGSVLKLAVELSSSDLEFVSNEFKDAMKRHQDALGIRYSQIDAARKRP